MNLVAAGGNASIQLGSGPRCFRTPLEVLAIVLAVVVGPSGCGSRGSVNATTSVNPSDAAKNAMELYDKDGSGSLDESELAASPGLLAARNRYDTDSDGQISQDEIAARLQSVFGAGAPWLTINCQVLQSGRPLAGAKVRFVPEPFFGDALQPATGTANGQGRVNPAVADEHHPDKLKGRNIMQPGVYRVEVEHPSVQQPHKPLGFEIDEFARGGTEAIFNL